jgi:hypothetical protein
MKALVKSTGQILDVKSHYETFSVRIELPKNLFDMLDEETKKSLSFDAEVDTKDMINAQVDKSLSNGTKYLLSDDKSYDEDELVVGLDNIRNLKLINII